jgi:outer membrane protein assembly factor BamE (lipoprotein component of BamABCDE complex)
LIAVLLLLPGCFVAKSIDDTTWDPATVAQLKVGTSTRADVLRLLGAPNQVVELLDSDAYVYRHAIGKVTGFTVILFTAIRSDEQRDGITVIVDRSGIVRAVGSRYNAERAIHGAPWADPDED